MQPRRSPRKPVITGSGYLAVEDGIEVNGTHAVFRWRGYIFNGNDCEAWSYPENNKNAKDKKPKDGFEDYTDKRPLLALPDNLSLQRNDQGKGQCISAAVYIKHCFLKHCAKDVDKFVELCKQLVLSGRDWRDLPQH